MAIRKIIHIDEEKCDGCGLCVTACAEGALQIINDKAKLVSETYCDGLGACIGDCPQGAITIEEREAQSFDEEAVINRLAEQERIEEKKAMPVEAGGCPGAAMKQLFQDEIALANQDKPLEISRLSHWPVQLMLVPPIAPFLKNADLLICADCVPFTVPDFHSRYLSGRAVVVGCPKLDDLQHYYEKLKDIFATALPRKITVLRMEVPCCGGIAQAAVQARNEAAPDIPIEVHTIDIHGGITFEKTSNSEVA